jgi:hypothetical protein
MIVGLLYCLIVEIAGLPNHKQATFDKVIFWAKNKALFPNT